MKNQVNSYKYSALALSDGSVWHGRGHGPFGQAVGEVCFNTAMTGYQEILTDPSYTGQFVVFTFPHIGNVGTNASDDEQGRPMSDTLPLSGPRAAILREVPTEPSNWRSEQDFDVWLAEKNCLAISGIDTRALTAHIRMQGFQLGVIHTSSKPLNDADIAKMVETAKNAPAMNGQDLAGAISLQAPVKLANVSMAAPNDQKPMPDIAVIDFGIKSNIVDLLSAQGLTCHLFPASTNADAVFSIAPRGIVLSNGPGDPQATMENAGKLLEALIASHIPILGICLGHQLLGLAMGAKTMKMRQGHHGANHPVQRSDTGQVEIVSMNHGYAIDEQSLPENLEVTHRSLFDGTISGLKLDGRAIISVQHHPEASPGPQEGNVIFEDFAKMVRNYKP